MRGVYASRESRDAGNGTHHITHTRRDADINAVHTPHSHARPLDEVRANYKARESRFYARALTMRFKMGCAVAGP